LCEKLRAILETGRYLGGLLLSHASHLNRSACVSGSVARDSRKLMVKIRGTVPVAELRLGVESRHSLKPPE
jgi:hypothetical protein